ncbi:MAG: DNA internalization-related competence protein ComEC/Rec2 [bacterium]|nr:DNA internalization-related competence protein ComEC/Rec2 [bacterium]
MFTPLFHLLLALIAGLLWSPFPSFHDAQSLLLPLALIWLLLFLSCLILATYRPAAELILSPLTALGAFLLGLLLGPPNLPTTSLPHRASAYIEASALEPPEWHTASFPPSSTQFFIASFLAQTSRIHWRGSPPTNLVQRVRCTLVSAQPIPLQRGDLFTVTGIWSRIPHASNPGQFDQATHFARQAIAYRFTARRGPFRWSSPPLSPALRFARSLDRLRSAARNALPSPPLLAPEAILLRAMLLGVRDPIPDDIAESLQRTSTLHIIAISGLHIGILGALWWALMWLLGVPGRWRAASMLPLLWLYALLVGLRSSVFRATLMFSLFALAPLAARPHRPTHTLAAVAFLYLLFSPQYLTNVGTLLTFLSVAALVLCLPTIDTALARAGWLQPPPSYDVEHPSRRFRFAFLRYFAQLFFATFAIWTITWPITLTRSHLITPSAWLANLLIIPALTPVLAGGFTTLLLAPLSSSLSSLVYLVTLRLLHLILLLVSWIASLPGSFFPLPALTPFALFCYYLSIGSAWYWLYLYGSLAAHSTLRRAVGVAALASFLLFLNALNSRNDHHGLCSVTALDVGLGDAFFIRSPEGHAILLDSGGRFASASMGSRVVIPYLRSVGVSQLDAVFLSHFDRDHAGGLPEVLDTIPVRAVYAPPPPPADQFASDLRSIAAARCIPWITVSAGFHHSWGSLRADALAPTVDLAALPRNSVPWDDNSWSLVLRFHCQGHSILFTGDATIASEALLLQYPAPLRSTVLKLAHHGSLTSSSPRFLDAVQPHLALLSVGFNHLGLPSPHVLALLQSRSVPLIRTDTHGALNLYLRPHAIHVEHFFVPR